MTIRMYVGVFHPKKPGLVIHSWFMGPPPWRFLFLARTNKVSQGWYVRVAGLDVARLGCVHCLVFPPACARRGLHVDSEASEPQGGVNRRRAYKYIKGLHQGGRCIIQGSSVVHHGGRVYQGYVMGYNNKKNDAKYFITAVRISTHK